MISSKKFIQLNPKTQIRKIADAVGHCRNQLLDNKNQVDWQELMFYYNICLKYEILSDVQQQLEKILYGSSRRDQLEKSHFLYHKLYEKIGLPINENQFIQIKNDYITDSEFSLKTDLIIILDNIRSAFNAGAIVRLAECLGIKNIYATGITPHKDHQKLLKTAKGTLENICYIYRKNIIETILLLKESGYTISAIEKTTKSISIYNYPFPKKTAIILGNEEIGVSQEILTSVHNCLEIDMYGKKNSLNVAMAAAIATSSYNSIHLASLPTHKTNLGNIK